MEKNKLKTLIFILSFVSFLFLFDVKVEAYDDYVVNVEEINNLVYGNKLKESNIVGNASVDGSFSFYNQEEVLDDIGEKSIKIVFTPSDLEKYNSKIIEVSKIVEKRKIGIVFSTPIYKQYDGNDSVVLPTYSLVGIINNEVDVIGDLIGKYSATYVGEDIEVILSGLELDGEKSECYHIDFLNHKGRIHPSRLEKKGDNETSLLLDKDVYIDVRSKLNVKREEVRENVNGKYTSFLMYSYLIYNHNNNLIDVDGKCEINMIVDELIMNKERLEIFEYNNGKYTELNYSYKDGHIYFKIDCSSRVVFTTRNIEWNLIWVFSSILLFSVGFVIVYSVKNSKMKSKEY